MCIWFLFGGYMALMNAVDSGQDIDGNPVEYDWYAPLPEPPEMYRAEPAVLEAGRIIRGRSIAHFIPDGRVVR